MEGVSLKFLVVGAGGQGAPCASILSRDKDISEIVLADVDLVLAKKVKDKIKSDKVIVKHVDAGKTSNLIKVAEGVDAIINMTLPRFNSNIMNAALKSGAHYVDSALGEPIWTQLIEHQPLELNDEYKEANLTALIACGGSPGVTNVLARLICDKLDRVGEIRFRFGGKSTEKPKDIVDAWDPGWCPEVALQDYANDATVFENGDYKTHPPFSSWEEYNFPDPVGPVLISFHSHEEPVTLPRFLGKGVRCVDFKYPIDTLAGALIKLGFASNEPIEVGGVQVAPMDVLMKLVRPPVNTFLVEDESTVKAPMEYAFAEVMEVEGEKSGEKVTYKVTRIHQQTAEERVEMYRRFGTANIYVAIPAIVGAKMCVEGEAEKGTIAPERLNPMEFLRRMANMGAPVKFHEMVSKTVSIS
jgi:saccharopine dehydrogenase-like NADP-dependent oxidoreductase